jgi:hypothetical protein
MKATLVTIILSVFSNIITPTVQKIAGITEGINLLKYWYVFVVLIFLVFIFDLLRLLLDEDKSAIFRASIYKVLLQVRGKKEDEKKYIINDINGRINLARRKLNYNNALMPKLVKIEWIDDETKNKDTYDLSEDQFVVKVSSNKSQDENIIDITYAVTKRTALNGVRHILSNNRPFENAIDNVFVEKMLRKIGLPIVLDKYYSNYLEPCLGEPENKKYYNNLKSIDDIGTFIRVFMVEVEDFSKRVLGREYRPLLLGEIESFLPFLLDINPDKTPFGVDLDYIKAFFKVTMVLIRAEKIKSVGIGNYLEAVDIGLRRGANSIYIVYFERRDNARNEVFHNYIKALLEEIAMRPTLEQKYDEQYEVYNSEGKKRLARCVRYINTEEN